jgi:hypothetical protein
VPCARLLGLAAIHRALAQIRHIDGGNRLHKRGRQVSRRPSDYSQARCPPASFQFTP